MSGETTRGDTNSDEACADFFPRHDLTSDKKGDQDGGRQATMIPKFREMELQIWNTGSAWSLKRLPVVLKRVLWIQ